VAWIHRIWNALRPGRVEREIARELSFHVAEREDQLRAEGIRADEAARPARRQLGNVLVQAERTREADVAAWLDQLLRDARLAVRALARTPSFTATVVLTLAVGIGATTAIFSVVNGVLIQALPFSRPDRLIALMHQAPGTGLTRRQCRPRSIAGHLLHISRPQCDPRVGRPLALTRIRCSCASGMACSQSWASNYWGKLAGARS
jgi:hypothetical protein